jgi:Glycosyltransferase family 87
VVTDARPGSGWRSVGWLATAWVGTRALLVAAPGWSGYPHHAAVVGDVRLYARWASILLSGHFPPHDPSWQYPPGAAGLLVLPGLTPLRYYPSFVVLALIVDALMLGVLVGRGRSLAGAWLWIAGPTALGPIVLNRFDTVPTLLAVAALAIGARAQAKPRADRSFCAGVLLGLGIAVKVWPVLLIPIAGGRGRQRGHLVAGAGIVGVVILVGLAASGRLGEGLDFRHNQQARGLQVETVAATPYLLARAFGGSGIRVVREYGAYQVHGPGVPAVVTVTTVATGLAIVAFLALAWRRPGNVGLGLAGLLGVLLVGRVLSPQYLVWALGLAAFGLTDRESRQRMTAGLLVAACALTQWLYPIWYVGLIRGAVGSTLLLAARNGVLLVAVGVALRAALSSPRPALEHSDGGQGMIRPIDTK